MLVLAPLFAHFSIAVIGLDRIGRRFVPREIAESARSSSVYLVGDEILELGAADALQLWLLPGCRCRWVRASGLPKGRWGVRWQRPGSEHRLLLLGETAYSWSEDEDARANAAKSHMPN